MNNEHMAFKKSIPILSLVAGTCIVVMLVVVISSIAGLTNAVKNWTNNYVRDVSKQSAQVIEERFKGLMNALKLIGDNMVSKTDTQRAEVLNGKVQKADFDEIVFVDKNGQTAISQTDNLNDEEKFLNQFLESDTFKEAWNGNEVVGGYSDRIAFMEPVRDKGEIIGILIGIRAKTRLESLLVNDAFDGKGVTFIIDQYGRILAENSDEKKLNELVGNNAASLAEDVALNYGTQSSPIILSKKTDSGITLLIDYQPLGMFNWTVVTMVQEDFLVQEVNGYVLRMIAVVVVLVGVFMTLFIVMIAMQSKYQKRLEEVAFIDPITGGKSFIRFKMLGEDFIQRGEKDDYALVSLNVKRFKMINRMGGSLEGDEILCRMHEICEAQLKYPDELSAHGNADNFYLLLKNEGEEILKERLDALTKDMEGVKTVLPIHVSQGVYVVSDSHRSQIDMIVYLDRANLARVSGTGEYHSTCVFYNDTFVKLQEDRVYMIGLIEEGLEKEQFLVYLQPKVSPKKSKVTGAEALVRWRHPELGMIGPNTFIPLCEQNGLICQLDLYVFRKVCEQIHAWTAMGYVCPIISVNVSGHHLRDISFLEKYREISDGYGIEPERIELELTESIMFSDSEIAEARSIIDAIHVHGYRCSMDDFGSGYSALGLLQELPIDCIKLDRSFFKDCINNPRSQIIIETVIKMAKRLFITTVAEGIEKERQVEMLTHMGCDMIQGFYFSPPLPMDDFAKMVFVDNTVYNPKGTSGKA